MVSVQSFREILRITKYLSIITLFTVYNAVACLFIMSLGQLLLYYILFVIKVFIMGYDQGSIHYNVTF